MRILKIWIFSIGGQQFFFKEYGNVQDNIIANMLNTGAINSFLSFFNMHLVKKNCDLMLFDDTLFNFHYTLDKPFKFITLLVTKIDKTIDLDSQAEVLKRVAMNISSDFYETYKEHLADLALNISVFEPFEERCDTILQEIADELEKKLRGTSIQINGF